MHYEICDVLVLVTMITEVPKVISIHFGTSAVTQDW